MHFFYNEGTKVPFTGKPKPYHELDANRYYLNHFRNSLELKWIVSNPLATDAERQQANREIPIADRKMEHWKKHPNYNQKYITEKCAELKKQWP